MTIMTRVFCNRAATVVDDAQGVIRGYVFIWGTPDTPDEYNTHFSKSRPPDLGEDIGSLSRPLSYEHNDSSGAIVVERIGRIYRAWFDDVGLRFEAQLDRAAPGYPAYIRDVRAGKLKTSSATAEHTADFYPDGAFKSWWLVEVALTENPAETRMPQVELVRSAEGVHAEPRADATLPTQLPEALPIQENPMNFEEMLMAWLTEQGMSLEDLQAYLDQMEAPADELSAPEATEPVAEVVQMSAPVAAMTAPAPRSAPANGQPSLTDVMAQLTAMKTAMQGKPVERNNERKALPNGGGKKVGANINLIETRKFAALSNDTMFALGNIYFDNLENPKVQPTEAFKRALAHRAFEYANSEEAQNSLVMSTLRSSITRADDFNASNIIGQGLEWVGTEYSNKIWEKARTRPIMDAVLSRGMMELEIGEGAGSVVIPLEGTDPTFYTTAQANDKDATARPEVTVNFGFAGTSSVTVTPGQITGAVGYTDILVEDGMIDVVKQLDYQLRTKGAEVVEYVFLNGDTETAANTNINIIDGTPAGGLSAPAYLVSNGVLKLPLVTNTAQSRDAGNALSIADFSATLAKFSGEQLANLDNILFAVNSASYQAILNELPLLTQDVAGTSATLFTGKVPHLFGVEVFRAGQLALANNVGKIPVAGGTLGRIAAIYAPHWAMVWKRRISFEIVRQGLSQMNIVVASMRLAFRYRDTQAAAVSYNVAVT